MKREDLAFHSRNWRKYIGSLEENISLDKISYFSSLRKEERELTKKEVLDIARYLHNPTSSGIWKLKAEWNSDDSICRYIENEMKKFIKDNKEISFNIGKRRMRINLEEDSDIKQQMESHLKKFTFYLRLFTHINTLDMPKKEQSISFLRSILTDEELILFEILDMKKIKRKYNGAYKLFIKSIYYEELDPIITLNKIFKFKKGNIILDQHIDATISITSLCLNSITIIKNFLEELNLIEEARIERFFSPEEVIFTPYITYFGAVYPKIVEYPGFQNLIDKAISEFSDENYPLCIGTIGIMAEDILIQIYETLFREEAREGLTLGQILDQIQREVKQVVSLKKKVPKVTISSLFSEVNEALNKIQSSTDIDTQKETLELIRKTLQYLKEEEKNTINIIKGITSSRSAISVFPKKILSNLNELIKYRNAISHKSRIPIGWYEAIRTVYCVVTLLIWWNEERKRIEWTKSKEEVIKDIIERNN